MAIVKLIDVVRYTESGNNYHALRFEPELYQNKPEWVTNQIQNIRESFGSFVSEETCLMVACSSFGAYQMLGANISAYGGIKSGFSIFDFIQNDIAQDNASKKMIRGLGFDPNIDFSLINAFDLDSFSSKWNGPGNISGYSNALKKSFEFLEKVSA